MKKAIGSIIFVIALIISSVYLLFWWNDYDAFYYAKVENPQVKELGSMSVMKYEYTIDAYSDSGKKKSLSFKTYYPLLEGDYLKLEVRSMGVHHYDVISEDEIPSQALSCINPS